MNRSTYDNIGSVLQKNKNNNNIGSERQINDTHSGGSGARRGWWCLERNKEMNS